MSQESEVDTESTIVSSFDELRPGYRDTRGRVTAKSSTRFFNGPDRETKYFFFTISDDRTGQFIRVVAYDKNHERLFRLVKRDKIYVLRNVWVKEANKQFTTDRLQIRLDRDSTLEEQLDRDNLNFVQLSQVGLNQFIDLIGVILEVSDLDTVYARGDRKRPVSRRHVTIADMSGHSMRVTIWDYQAEHFEGVPKDVIVTRRAHIENYGGLSASASDTVFINPTIEHVRRVKYWYSRLGNDHRFVPLTKPLGYN